MALLSAEQSASVVWNDEENDTKSMDVAVGESDRLFTFEVAKTNEQEEGAMSRPGFQVHIPSSCLCLFLTLKSKMVSRHISRYIVPDGCPIDPSTFFPRLLRGETAQGFMTAIYVRRQIRSDTFRQRPLTKIFFTQLL